MMEVWHGTPNAQYRYKPGEIKQMAIAPDRSPAAAALVRYLNEETSLDELQQTERQESERNKAKLREALPLRGEQQEPDSPS